MAAAAVATQPPPESEKEEESAHYVPFTPSPAQQHEDHTSDRVSRALDVEREAERREKTRHISLIAEAEYQRGLAEGMHGRAVGGTTG